MSDITSAGSIVTISSINPLLGLLIPIVMDLADDKDPIKEESEDIAVGIISNSYKGHIHGQASPRYITLAVMPNVVSTLLLMQAYKRACPAPNRFLKAVNRMITITIVYPSGATATALDCSFIKGATFWSGTSSGRIETPEFKFFIGGSGQPIFTPSIAGIF